MNYINIKHTNKSGNSETVKYATRYNRTNGLLFTMLDLYLHLTNDPLPKDNESLDVKVKWYLNKITEFHNSLWHEKRGNKYRYSINIENSKRHVGLRDVAAGSEVIISTPYMSLKEGIQSDIFKFEIHLLDPKFYTYHVGNFNIGIDIRDWTLEEEKLIYDNISRLAHIRIALSTLFNDYIGKLRKAIIELKDDKNSKKLLDELSSVDTKHIWKYNKIWEYVDKLNQLYGTKNEKLPSYVNTTEISYFISSYKKLGEFFANIVPQNIATNYLFSSLFDRWKKIN